MICRTIAKFIRWERHRMIFKVSRWDSEVELSLSRGQVPIEVRENLKNNRYFWVDIDVLDTTDNPEVKNLMICQQAVSYS